MPIDKPGIDASLEEILHYCSTIRGVSATQHRILGEFHWFVKSCIWGKSNYDMSKRMVEAGLKEDMFGAQEGLDIYNKNKGKIDFLNNRDLSVWIKWGQLFLEYCEEQYKGDTRIV